MTKGENNLSNAIHTHAIRNNNGIECKVDYFQNGDQIYGLIMRVGEGVSASPSLRIEGSDTIEGAVYNVKKFTESNEYSRWLRGET